MKRFGSVVLVLAILISIGVHFLLFRVLIFDEKMTTAEPERYEVTLKYHKKLPAPEKEQKKRQVKKREVEEKSLEKKEEIPVQEQEEYTPEEEADLTKIEGGQVLQEETADLTDKGAVVEERGPQYDRAVEELREKIIRRKMYPQAARRRNIEGVVLVFLELDAGGQPVELRIIQSSGSRILDNAALSLIEKVIPFEHGMDGTLSVEIPIRYDLEE